MYYMIYRILYYISFTASEMYKITSPEFFLFFILINIQHCHFFICVCSNSLLLSYIQQRSNNSDTKKNQQENYLTTTIMQKPVSSLTKSNS